LKISLEFLSAFLTGKTSPKSDGALRIYSLFEKSIHHVQSP
jgi:hypothetical protein